MTSADKKARDEKREKMGITPITADALDIPFTPEDMLLFQSDPKEYNRVARASKQGIMGIVGLAQRGSISNQTFHLALRFSWDQLKSTTVYGKTPSQRRDEIVGMVHLLLGTPRGKEIEAAMNATIARGRVRKPQ